MGEQSKPDLLSELIDIISLLEADAETRLLLEKDISQIEAYRLTTVEDLVAAIIKTVIYYNLTTNANKKVLLSFLQEKNIIDKQPTFTPKNPTS